MKFHLYQYFETHPRQKQAAKWWIRLGLPLPERMKRQIANQIHAEMLVRLTAVILQKGTLDWQQALAAQYELGQEIAAQTADILSLQTNDVGSLAKIVDFLHGLLDIGGKQVVMDTAGENVCRWTNCPLAAQLKGSPNGAGVAYCHLYQEMYKGVLFALNPNARANTLEITQSLGKPYCEIRTFWECWSGLL